MRNNVIESFYLSDASHLKYALDLLEMSEVELEDIVGRFESNHVREGRLKGLLEITEQGIRIRHHFTRRILWQN
jgi:hypothetical protein